MTALVVGASGATGRLLVEQLLDRGQQVRILVRSRSHVPEHLARDENLTVVRASALELGDAELARHVRGCDAVASCLGHNLSMKGLFGSPRRLVADTTRRLCEAVEASQPAQPVRFVLMNTAGSGNRDLSEPISVPQKVVVWLLRSLLPPHADNEQAADYLRVVIGQDHEAIEWAVVRPDTLRERSEVTEYTVHPSPTRSAIFDAGVTSRINVAHFMAELITSDDAWKAWKGQMPVIYDREGGRGAR